MLTKDVSSNSLNPYDFSHPVDDRDLFSGRDEIIEEVAYYLDQAVSGNRPTNLALIGPRASGKTSLLNLVDWEANHRGFCIARVALNESDAQSDLNFFFKLIDSIFIAACRFDRGRSDRLGDYPFGGEWGETHSAYIDLTGAYETDLDRKWRPFSFPSMYAAAMRSGNTNVLVNDTRIIGDLKLISEEVGQPIILLFDEANVLSLNRILLQKIRNIFQQLRGYMLVIAGTDTLFPVMDDVFSPIARDFKRIEVGPFQTRDEAQDCVFRPLRNMGMSTPKQLFHRDTLLELCDPQGFTGGNPYQIQLLCHFLFRDMQGANRTRMAFSVEVLDAVLKELAGGREILNSPIIKTFTNLNRKEIRDLNILCVGMEFESIDERLLVRRIFMTMSEEEIDSLYRSYEKFIEIGLLKVSGKGFHFSGDERELLYAKYYARKVGGFFAPLPIPASVIGVFRLGESIASESGWKLTTSTYSTAPDSGIDLYVDFRSTVDSLFRPHLIADRSEDQPKVGRTLSPLISALYEMSLMEAFKSSGDFALGMMTIKTEHFTRRIPFHANQDIQTNLESMTTRTAAISQALGSAWGNVEWEFEIISLPSIDQLWTNIQSLISDPEELAELHLNIMQEGYPHSKEVVGVSLWCASKVQYLIETREILLDTTSLNNLAYIYMGAGEWEIALNILNEALGSTENDALVQFNIAVSLTALGKIDDAIMTLNLVRYLGRSEYQQLLCLIIPTIDEEGSINFQERMEPSFEECIENTALALSTIQNCVQKNV